MVVAFIYSATLDYPHISNIFYYANLIIFFIWTSASVEGETTSHYISDCLKDTKVKITRLARGVPVGGEIEFLDDGTLYSAFKNRSSVVND